MNFTLTDKQKAVLLSVASIVAVLGFLNIAGFIEQLPAKIDIIVTAVSSLISVVTALATDIKNLFKKDEIV